MPAKTVIYFGLQKNDGFELNTVTVDSRLDA
jgi:hypothetical protein